MIGNCKVSIVVSIGKNREIGLNNGLLWDIPEDRKHFRDITYGHVVIWGRKTFDSVLSYIHKAPTGRTNIVVTSDKDYKYPDVLVVNSLDAAFKLAQETEEDLQQNKDHKNLEIFIGGGGKIYTQALPYVDKLYLTIVDGQFEADTFFPDYSDFKIIESEDKESSGYKYKFVNLIKK